MKPQDRLADALWEAERHQRTLAEALAEWDSAPAADWQSLETHRAKVRLVDQLLFRFIKLQDAVGERLVPANTRRVERTVRRLAHARSAQPPRKAAVSRC